MTGLPERQLFATPFAGGSGAAIAPITDAGADFCFDKGFDSAFSAPHSNGGKYVTRAQMNRIGNLATKNDFYRMCGGINTFDPVFAQKIGGYPKGAILDYFNGTDLLKILSLVDNNLTDFRNESYGGKWMLLNQGEQELNKTLIVSYDDYEFPAAANPYDNASALITFKSPASGLLFIDVSSYERTIPSPTHEGGINSYGRIGIFGQAFLARTFSSIDDVVFPNISPSIGSSMTYNDYFVVPGLPTNSLISSWYASNLGTGHVEPNYEIKNVSAGEIVSVCIQNGFGYSISGTTTLGAWDLSISFRIYII